MDILKVDALAWWNFSKRQFLRDIKNSFHQVTHTGLEPHQFFSFWNISTNTVARDVQSFGQNGPLLAGWLSYGQNFFLKFAQTLDEQMLKISRRYYDSYSNYSWMTEFVATNGPLLVNIIKSDQKGSIGCNKFLVI